MPLSINFRWNVPQLDKPEPEAIRSGWKTAMNDIGETGRYLRTRADINEQKRIAEEDRQRRISEEERKKKEEEKERIRKLKEELPGIDCGCCGAPTCRAFAEDVVRGNATMDQCLLCRVQPKKEDAE